MLMNEEKLREGASPDISRSCLSSGQWSDTSTAVPREMALTIYVDTRELVTILCTPTKLNCLVLGFLYSEGIISSLSDVASMRICEEDSLADIRLAKAGFKLPGRSQLRNRETENKVKPENQVTRSVIPDEATERKG